MLNRLGAPIPNNVQLPGGIGRRECQPAGRPARPITRGRRCQHRSRRHVPFPRPSDAGGAVLGRSPRFNLGRRACLGRERPQLCLFHHRQTFKCDVASSFPNQRRLRHGNLCVLLPVKRKGCHNEFGVRAFCANAAVRRSSVTLRRASRTRGASATATCVSCCLSNGKDAITNSAYVPSVRMLPSASRKKNPARVGARLAGRTIRATCQSCGDRRLKKLRSVSESRTSLRLCERYHPTGSSSVISGSPRHSLRESARAASSSFVSTKDGPVANWHAIGRLTVMRTVYSSCMPKRTPPISTPPWGAR